MLIAPTADHSRHAVSVNGPTAENPDGYHRLIGGGVELGETHRGAIIREVREELGAEIRDLSLLGVVENLFTIDGQPGHEIVFVYTGTLDPAPAASGAFLIESDGIAVPVVWRSLTGVGERLPLYPSAVEALARRLADANSTRARPER